ncbi:PQQ-binding-like beta-propeller repeat protein [Nocardiopsis sp. CNT312]|uniref:outer membrane protein assembly factor BamB family protein n=1 Tax=Nocardiopsis sp. CNT312 TaxID=1137268 RepID=UPI0004900606|nr:PQQ-binding-like beta-propeller repeat protein [Nocardiopsis sp. CNT312]
MRSARVPQVVSCGLAVLVAACTPAPEPVAPEPSREPTPVPTDFTGDPPPGIDGDVLRFLHGDEAEVHALINDPAGVRISPVGSAFLFSSGSEDRHLLHDAATGTTLWEGEARFLGFGADGAGERVLLMSDEDGRFALDAAGKRVWEPEEEGDTYLDGIAVRYPQGWSAEEPGGDYAVLGAEGAVLWEYTLDPVEPEDEASPSPSPDGPSDGPEDGGREEPEEGPEAALGVPVAAWEDLVLLESADAGLRAHSLAGDDAGEELWALGRDDGELGRGSSMLLSAPRVLGVYTLPEDEDGAGAGERVLLVRWTGPEDPSVLAAYDPADGALLWFLEEPGPNPVRAPFETSGVPGSLYDGATGTLLLPQASGEATLVAVGLADGEVRWGLEEDDVSLAPAFAHDGLVYADSRTNDGGDRQLVLEAETMDVVADEMTAYVEAVTDSGHAILVQGRQRFVFGPPPGEEPEEAPSRSPSGAPSANPSEGVA